MPYKITSVIIFLIFVVFPPTSAKISDNEIYFRDKISLQEISKTKNKTDNKLNNATYATGSFNGFFDLVEIFSRYDLLQTQYPEYFIDREILGFTFENKPIAVWWFGNSESPHEILFTGMHHANEPSGMMVLTFFIEKLLETAASDPESTEALLLKNRKIAVIPCLNPDGYVLNILMGASWRKNRSLPDSNSHYHGVDLNRNYGPEEFWNSPFGYSATENNSDLYRGPFPFSEKETRAVKDLCESNSFNLALNYHSFGNFIIYPFSALARETSDSAYYRELTLALTKENRFLTGLDSSTVRYHCRGTSDDWMYQENENKNKIFAMTVEIGNYSDAKYPRPERMDTLCYQNYSMNMKALECAGYSTHIKTICSKFDESTNKCFIELEVVNTGRNSGMTNYIFTAPSGDLVFDEQLQTINFKSPGEKQYLKIPITITNNITNGSEKEIIIQTGYPDNVRRLDTLNVILWKSDSRVLFASEEDFNKWETTTGGWGVEKDILSNRMVLSDSPGGNYSNIKKNYLTFRDDIDLSEKNNAYLQFDFRLITERKYDVALVQASIDSGKSWNNLETGRMIRGESLANGAFKKTMTGLSGVFPDWIRQKADLSEFCGNNIKLRFLMLSDGQVFLDGIYLDSVIVHEYDDSIMSADEKSLSVIDNVYPNPVNQGDYLFFDMTYIPANVVLFDISGKKLFNKNTYENKIKIPGNISSGIYYIRIDSHEKTISYPVFVR